MAGRENEGWRRVEAAALRRRVEGPGPSLTLVVGAPRAGKTTLLRQALEGVDAFRYVAAPLPDAEQRGFLAERLRLWLLDSSIPSAEVHALLGDDPGWPELFEAMVRPYFRTLRPTVVALDGWERLVQGRRRLARELTEFWLTVRRRGGPFHLVLGSAHGAPLEPFRDGEGPLADWLDEEIILRPLPLREATRTAAEAGAAGARERVLRFAVFGGWPGILRHVDSAGSLEENVVARVLARDAPLGRWGIDLLEREFQAAGRYASILRALAEGARDWGGIRARVRDIGSSGQLAPYIRRLEEADLVECSRSLDAAPGSRRRRYRIVDPFTAFWFRFVLPHLTELELGRGEELWRARIEPALDGFAGHAFPAICREWTARHAAERLPAAAAEVGALWGRGYELEVAGELGNRDPVFGVTRWGARASTADATGVTTRVAEVARVTGAAGATPAAVTADAAEAARAIGRHAERTRYGAWRRTRHRLVFTDEDERASGPADARDDPLHVVTLRDLVGAS